MLGLNYAIPGQKKAKRARKMAGSSDNSHFLLFSHAEFIID
jgi:hypothetical protein